ncbi:hypothetical protein C2U55_17040 [Enterobacteriaceae bacterium ENNIH3]|nr:hypothetical protein C2U55_17040 [Enterobacteriaceae bacterium ENNIH3]
MTDSRTAPYASLLLRLALGILFLAHFSLKFFVFTPAGTAKFFASLGLPGGLAYLTMAVELVGAIALILGILWGGDRFCIVVIWGKKGDEAMNGGGCEARRGFRTARQKMIDYEK